MANKGRTRWGGGHYLRGMALGAGRGEGLRDPPAPTRGKLKLWLRPCRPSQSREGADAECLDLRPGREVLQRGKLRLGLSSRAKAEALGRAHVGAGPQVT